MQKPLKFTSGSTPVSQVLYADKTIFVTGLLAGMARIADEESFSQFEVQDLNS